MTSIRSFQRSLPPLASKSRHRGFTQWTPPGQDQDSISNPHPNPSSDPSTPLTPDQLRKKPLSYLWTETRLESKKGLNPHEKQRLKREYIAKHGRTTVFSGIQPTGVPHLGNYLGALKPWVQQQDAAHEYTRLIYSVVDLHSLTSRAQTAAQRRTARTEGYAALLACGLNPDRSTIFFQSDNADHAELHWILSCVASMGALTRMTQWKSKLADDAPPEQSAREAKLPWERQDNDGAARLRLGLFSYPVLQAADILLYNATQVPVGEDQIQHIEFARDLAAAFNNVAGSSILKLPEAVVSPAKRVMSLTDPTKKMSKSHPSVASRVLLNDSEEVIRKKFRSALTDSADGVTYDLATRPGVSNLIEIIANLDGNRSCKDVAEELDQMQVTGSKMKLLKDRAADLVVREFQDIRASYESFLNRSDGQQIDNFAEKGARQARAISGTTIARVKRAVGLKGRNPPES